MLTCKVGNSTINCVDGKYDRYRLKQWSKQGILKCPVCNGDYEYCHGEIAPPYFRHVGKDCEGYYSESETEEHSKGKKLLYNWIKNQHGVTNCELESWIPETKQRPDIYFEKDRKRYVIEFQCTPIASEFLIRRELYKLAGINDIWILGKEKYNIGFDKFGIIHHSKRYRKIEKESMESGLMYLDVKNNSFLLHSSFLEKKHSLLQSIKHHYSKISFYRRNNNIFHGLYSINEYFVAEKVNNMSFENEIKLENIIVDLFNKLESDLSLRWEIYTSKKEKLREEENVFDEMVKEIKKYSEYVGEIGDSLEADAMLTNKKPFQGWYGTSYVFEAIDRNKNVFVWFDSTPIKYKKGDRININGTIRNHTEYLGVKQTQLINPAIASLE